MSAPAKESDPLQRLSPRERQVLLLFLEGLSLKEMAHRLNISTSRVMTCKRRTLRKFKLSSDVELVIYCIRQGILSLYDEAA